MDQSNHDFIGTIIIVTFLVLLGIAGYISYKLSQNEDLPVCSGRQADIISWLQVDVLAGVALFEQLFKVDGNDAGSAAGIDAQGDAFIAGLAQQPHCLGQESDREIVDAIVAIVLEDTEGDAFAGTRKPRDQDQLHRQAAKKD
jgi:hypothetical protein